MIKRFLEFNNESTGDRVSTDVNAKKMNSLLEEFIFSYERRLVNIDSLKNQIEHYLLTYIGTNWSDYRQEWTDYNLRGTNINLDGLKLLKSIIMALRERRYVSDTLVNYESMMSSLAPLVADIRDYLDTYDEKYSS
jgi:hypothetical protein